MPSRSKIQPERGRDGGRDKLGIRPRRQLDDPDPIGKSWQQMSANLESEACLANATRADQRDKTLTGAELHDLVQLDFAPNQFRNRFRQIRRSKGRSSDRGGPSGVRQRIRTRRDCADLAGKLLASSGNRADQIAIRSKCLPQCRDLGRQIVLIDDPVRPGKRYQPLSADNNPARLNQRH
jgi:hypothetical protein